MAQHRSRQSVWPPKQDNQPDACFLAPDGYLRSERSLAGPLRHGTHVGTGPKGDAVIADNTRASDFGMDRIAPRDFDPLGTCRSRSGEIPSDLIARQKRQGGEY
jgi:hypothetical protein